MLLRAVLLALVFHLIVLALPGLLLPGPGRPEASLQVELGMAAPGSGGPVSRPPDTSPPNRPARTAVQRQGTEHAPMPPITPLPAQTSPAPALPAGPPPTAEQPSLQVPAAPSATAGSAPAAAPAASTPPGNLTSPPISGVAPPAPSPAPAPETLVPATADAAYLQNPRPEYPLLARQMGIEGTVRLRVKVSASGSPLDVQVESSSGSALLDRAAIRAVWRYRFVPARRGQRSVEDVVSVPVRFRLQDDER